MDRLREMKDEDIDYSDIPPTDAAFWAKAKLYPPLIKEPISIRIDADVLGWFRNRGPRYQSLMNAVLRLYMEAQEAKPVKVKKRKARVSAARVQPRPR
jgi:uncharacterized protein (DUF4415 family)